MGCAQTRNKTEEQGIKAFEGMLKFDNLTIRQIKQVQIPLELHIMVFDKAFFQVNGSGTISRDHLEEVFEELGLEYSDEEKDVVDRFLAAFFLFEEGNHVEHYDLIQLLSVLFLLSKSSQKEKASSLFDLFDEKGAGKLTRIQFENEIERLVEIVFLYSERLLDNDEGVVDIHREITREKKGKMMSHIYSVFFKNNRSSIITKEFFVRTTQMSCKEENMIDFTDPIRYVLGVFSLNNLNSIRAKLMDYVLGTAQSQIQLQNKYSFRRSARLSQIFSEDQFNVRTQANSLLSSPLRKSCKI